MSLPKIAIVDSQEIFRIGLAQVIKNWHFIRLSYIADDSKKFLELQNKHQADIVLVEDHVILKYGFEILFKAKSKFPRLRIVILTLNNYENLINQFIEADIHGIIIKTIDCKKLETAIQSILDGEHYYSTELMRYFTDQIRLSSSLRNQKKLSNREIEVLQLIFEGYGNKEIARKLFISERTVSNHRFSMKNKLGTKSNADMIAYGIKYNLLKLP